MNRYSCGKCQHIFNEREVKCEDWRIPEKSFICPECDTSLNIKAAQKAHMNIKKMLPSVVAPIIGATVGKVLSQFFTIDQTMIILGCAFIFFLPFAPKQFKSANQPMLVRPYE